MRKLCLSVALWLSSAMPGGAALAHDGTHALSASSMRSAPLTLKLPDNALVDQHGQRGRFLSDVLAGDIAVIGFHYSNCVTLCPVSNAILQQLDARFGDEPPLPVRIVTITVDPERDDAAAMLAGARQFGASDRWSWLTGAPGEVKRVLRLLGMNTTAAPEAHDLFFLVGDPLSGAFERVAGPVAPEHLHELVMAALKRRGC